MDYDPRNIELGRKALAFGWLSNEQAKWCLDEATRQRRALVEVAHQANLLTEQQCGQLMQVFTGVAELSQDGQNTVLSGDLAVTVTPGPRPSGSSESQTVQNPPKQMQSGSGAISSTVGSQSRPSVGDIFDDYEITRLLGEGGMGAVFAAKQGHGEYALKVITCDDFSAIARFEREATAVAAVDNHPNVVKIHKYGSFNGMPYLVFDMIDGKSLDHDIQPGEPYGIEKSVSIVQTIAEALDYCHNKGVLHRDIKPANVLIRKDGKPFLTDFGLAKSEDSESLTQTSDFLGTPNYMAPEQAASENDKVGPCSDIWAVGAILYELVTGYKPFPGSTLMMIVNAILFRDPIDPRKHNETLSEDLETIILQCLNKDIEKRYPT
ncbi:MAG: serine/threonine-protein kinase, partial [Planctomycetota bacterium]|nr:serine/threonine-protein kinase [Planctomycetota bacterium]